jgi:hypothetical protein
MPPQEQPGNQCCTDPDNHIDMDYAVSRSGLLLLLLILIHQMKKWGRNKKSSLLKQKQSWCRD